MIEFLTYISFGFIGMQLVNVVINFIFLEKIGTTKILNKKLISVLIPARNEEKNIADLLSTLSKIKNDNLEILVYDDESTDNTAKIVKKFSINDNRIKLINPNALPENWLGKNHACYQLSKKASGEYFLFIDADVKLHGNIISDTVFYLEKYNLGLLSIFPIQIQKTIGEKVTVPIMNYILLTLLPLILVRKSPFKSHSAANGQFMLFKSDIYRKFSPHKLFKDCYVEDIVISKFLKEQKIKIACITGENRVKCRMYNNYKEALNGFSKNIFMFYGNKPALAFIFWIFACFGFVPVLIFKYSYLIIYLTLIVLIQILYSIIGKQNIFLNIIFFPLHLIFMLQVMINGLKIQKNKMFLWKQRNVYR